MSKKDEALGLALEALAMKFSEGWHEGIKIDASDIMLLNDAAQALAEQPAQQEFVAHCEGGPEFCSVCHKELNPSPAIYPEEAYEMGLEEIAYYTSPPAQKKSAAWTLLLTGEHHGLVGKAGEKFVGAPEYYERVDVYTSPPQQEPVKSGEGASATVTITLPAQQEPVAWRDPKNVDPGQGCTYDKAKHEKWPHIYTQPLYTSPRRTWVELTDEEIPTLTTGLGPITLMPFRETKAFVRAISAKLQEKNT